jgi:hypothetical protein
LAACLVEILHHIKLISRRFIWGSCAVWYFDFFVKRVLIRPILSKMRCSACHNSGGPIMKELNFPHSDWWSKDNLIDFGNAQLSHDLSAYVENFIDASEFSKSVGDGIKLLNSSNLEETLSIKEQLRPLFCTTEINLESDSVMFLDPKHQFMKILSEIFVNPLLAKSKTMTMDKEMYSFSLHKYNSTFPENGDIDAQFGFHAPVKSYVNILAIKKLIKSNMIDEEFALDILFVDYKNPLFSKKRCSLLAEINNSINWKSEFIMKLKSKKNKIYIDLLKSLLVPNKEKHQELAQEYLVKKEITWKSQAGVDTEVWKLNTLRKSVFTDEISKNPLGQILEPGFRIVFPVFK